MCDKSQLYDYIEDRKELVSKIEKFSVKCDIDKLLESIDRFHDLTSKISNMSMNCLSSNNITENDHDRIRDETNDMYTQIKRMVNENLRERCDVEWYAV
ncbi:MAG: hypothetical protein ACETWM_18995 [Candidatus Lokiarchaeia archaeon]